MSTRAQVDMMNRNKKTYRFWIYRDGYPKRGKLKFSGTFAEAKQTFQDD